MKPKNFKFLIISVLFVLTLSSCATIISGVTETLTDGVFQQNDIELVKDAAPAYLLIIEGMIYKNPTNRDYLMAGVQLYSTYASAFVDDVDRKQIFDTKVVTWGTALLQSYPLYKKYDTMAYSDRESKDKAFNKFIDSIKMKDIPYIFWGMYAIGMDALNNSDNPAGLLMLPRLLKIAGKIYDLDSSFFNGSPHLFFGLYYGSYPEAFGGSPEKSKEEFTKAIEISKGKMLAHKVMFAEVYYKNQYDRENYEKILNEILEFDVNSYPEYRLMNIMAQKQAKELLETIDDFFF